ncbi:MAG: hypothetical protein J0H38_01060 [Rhizobiales bacterium]|nr:hypothetical protein [Hyphomicrobiales bacterium]
MRRSIGRQKQSILGTVRKQLTLDVGVEIVTAMLDDFDKRNGKLEKPIAHLYFEKGRRAWVSQRLSQMASLKWSATGGNDVERLWNAVGDLVITGRTKTGLNIYHPSDSATGIEIGCFLGLVRGRSVSAAHRSSEAVQLLTDGAAAIGDRTLEVAYAEECERYRFTG